MLGISKMQNDKLVFPLGAKKTFQELAEASKIFCFAPETKPTASPTSPEKEGRKLIWDYDFFGVPGIEPSHTCTPCMRTADILHPVSIFKIIAY